MNKTSIQRPEVLDRYGSSLGASFAGGNATAGAIPHDTFQMITTLIIFPDREPAIVFKRSACVTLLELAIFFKSGRGGNSKVSVVFSNNMIPEICC